MKILIPILCLLLLPGCSNSKTHPPEDAIRQRLESDLPTFIEVVDFKAEHVPSENGVTTKFKLVLKPKEDLFEVDPTTPEGFTFLKMINKGGEKTEVYGTIPSERTVDKWTLGTPHLQAGDERFGKPKGTFPNAFMSGSPEAASAIKARDENQRQQAAARRDRALQQEKDQADQAAAEKLRLETSRKTRIQSVLNQISVGSTFAGTTGNPDAIKPIQMRILEITPATNSGKLIFSSPTLKTATRTAIFTYTVDEKTEEIAIAGNLEQRLAISVPSEKEVTPEMFWRLGDNGKPLGTFSAQLNGSTLTGRYDVFWSYPLKLARQNNP